jgi:hypothetical protein
MVFHGKAFLAPGNINLMFVTLLEDTSHNDKSWSKAFLAPANIDHMFVTLDTSRPQWQILWSSKGGGIYKHKTHVCHIVETSQLAMSPLKDLVLLLLNILLPMFVTLVMSQPTGNVVPMKGIGSAKHVLHHVCHIGHTPRGQILVKGAVALQNMPCIVVLVALDTFHDKQQNVLIKGVVNPGKDMRKVLQVGYYIPLGCEWGIQHTFVQSLVQCRSYWGSHGQ